mgnify:CR=1 FL=1
MGRVWNVIAKRLDKIGYGIIDFITIILNKIKPGWALKNRAKIEEWKLMVYAFNRSLLGVIGLVLIIIYLFLGIFGPILAPYKYNEYPTVALSETYIAEPGKYGFLLGTENYGRDVLSLLLYGARFSLVLTLLVIVLSAPIGIGLGLISGYFGGKIDEAIQRLTDIFYAFPTLVLALALAAILPERLRMLLYELPWLKDFLLWLFAGDPKDVGTLAPFLSIIVAIAVVGWPGYTRLVRGMVLSVKENVYVEAARALGVSDWRIIQRHILPNIISVVVVMITFDLSGIVILGAALSFLGLGAQDPFTDWGKLVQTGSRYFPTKWWLIIFPGATLFLVGLGWTFFGDTLRDILDPATRRRLEYGVEEFVTKGDIMAAVGELLILVAIVYGGYAAWDIMASIYMIGIVLLSFVIYKLIWYFIDPESKKPPIAAFVGLAPVVYGAIKIHLLSHVFLAIALILFYASPYFKEIPREEGSIGGE